MSLISETSDWEPVHNRLRALPNDLQYKAADLLGRMAQDPKNNDTYNHELLARAMAEAVFMQDGVLEYEEITKGEDIWVSIQKD